jgi:hypothetical protein
LRRIIAQSIPCPFGGLPVAAAVHEVGGHPVEVANLPVEEWSLVQRIAATPTFTRSDFLTKFLLYICDRKLRGHEDEITEYQIGTHALGRPESFHTGEDNIVRNYARLLRKNLAEYFEHEGSEEELVLEIPKGHYRPVFRRRELKALAVEGLKEETVPTDPLPVRTTRSARSIRTAWWLVGGLILLSSIPLGIRLHKSSLSADANMPLERLWGPFWIGNPPLVIFSNALFTGDQSNGMRYVASMDKVKNGEYVDTYTGVGEVNAVYDLTRLFQERHATFTLKRSLLVTWDEARQRDLIFIGSVANNPALRVIADANSMDFAITADNGFSGVVNRRPHRGELQIYARTSRPLTRDYAIVALIPGLEPGRRVLIFSGTTTFGTQAAVEFACGPEEVADLMRVIAGPSGSVRPFEAIIETTVGGNVPLQTKLIVVHLH